MPKTYTELAQGNYFTRSSEGGSSVDSAQRVFKVILNEPGEAWEVDTYLGIDVGDPYSQTNQIPCVGWEARHDGESRLVMLVTYRYRSTPGGVDGTGGGGRASDPKLQPPATRPALYSLSTSLVEVPAPVGRIYDNNAWVGPGLFLNSAKDRLEGLTKLEPVVTATITQYSATDQSSLLQYTGSINSDTFSFSGHSVPPHTCMFQGLSITPYVESGFRGFELEFQFSFRVNHCDVSYGVPQLGWDKPVVDSGYNIINTGLNSAGVEQEHLLYELDSEGNIKTPKALLGTGKVRAQIPAAGLDGKERQHGAASPVFLNSNGSPRSRSLPPRVLRAQTQPDMIFGNNFSAFGIRSFY